MRLQPSRRRLKVKLRLRRKSGRSRTKMETRDPTAS